MDPYHRIPEKFEEFTQKYHSEIEKTSLISSRQTVIVPELVM